MALITVIPLLAYTYVLIILVKRTGGLDLGSVLVVAIAMVCMLLGYGVLCSYPVNLARLRRMLEDLLRDVFGLTIHSLESLPLVPAMEEGLQSAAEAHRVNVDRVQHELARIDSLLNRRLSAAASGHRETRAWMYFRSDREQIGPVGRALGTEAAANLLQGVVDLAESATAAYEQDGSFAQGIAASPWAQAFCQKGPALFEADAEIRSNDPHRPEPQRSLRSLARHCIQRGVMVDGALDTGMQGFFVPVWARGQIVGTIGFVYGSPPGDPEARRELAERYDLAAGGLPPAPPPAEVPLTCIVSMAKNSLTFLARLVGESVERNLAEDALREHQGALEAMVQSRTAELEQANAQLQDEIKERQHAEELKDEFVSTVSHELRTPLAITKEGIALLLDGIPGDVNDKQRKVLASAKGNIERLARIINDLLDISKIEAGKMEMAKDRVDFITLAEGVVRNFEPLARQKGLHLETRWDLDHREVLADQDRIIQVLTNLISNAIKFTLQGGVRVIAANHDRQLECVVEDTGVGLAKDEVGRVFEKFTQFGRTHGAGERGTGLGLAIAKQIVERHRGRIWVESAPGRGSRFIFTLPLYSEEELIRETIESAISDSRVQKDSFTLLLFVLTPHLPPQDKARQRLYETGFQRLRDLQHLVRSSDRMITRGHHEVIMVARITPAQVVTLYRRWHAQMSACFNEVDPQLDVQMACGYAEYPLDGSTSEELMAKARQTLSQAEGSPTSGERRKSAEASELA
ncbi:MAG: hypothetical protein K8T26_14630 [Lentisphaerae bacterium]|nr:hypothetical protein [Lentisphaerota bacterium]